MKDATFIIYCPSYDENSGGSIALHRLCDIINREGGEAYLYPMRPHFEISNPLFSLIDAASYFFNKKKYFQVHPKFKTPITNKYKSKKSIVIYPEIISGNPLNAKKVVRWLLHKPGFHTGIIEYNKSDLVFYFQEAFQDRSLGMQSGGKLQVIHLLTDIYKRTNFNGRSGTCYLLRKGKGREIVHDLEKSTLIDDLPHEEIVEIFNRTERLISYDTYTLYSQYAAACGCISIVVPENGVSKDTWQPVEELRYGISYGFEEIQWAEETQERAVNYLKSQEIISIQSVRHFISSCKRYFF